ncbi:hypothetical protein, partial [Methylacidimicrobium cyclopophantes]|uniref:hypothetical protein n=1 Tax=Methylacidimicrobium cyclopophantes TaxID=1041766 RepID=UPI001C498E64
FRSFLAGRWSATEFLAELVYLSRNLHPNPKNPDDPFYVWDLSAMPSWFWEEIAEFVEGPNAYPAFSEFERSGKGSPSNTGGLFLYTPLDVLAATLKDKKMEQALDAVAERWSAEAGY